MPSYPKGEREVVVPLTATTTRGTKWSNSFGNLQIKKLWIFVCHELQLTGVYAEG